MAIPTSTTSLETNYFINQMDGSLNGATITTAAGGTSATAYSFAGATKTEILIVVGGTTGANLGTLQLTWNVYEPTTGSIIATYAGSNLTAATVDHIGVYNAGTILGGNGFLSWTVSTIPNATWNPVYARVYIK